ncbi:cation diffusion facilitator family transporter [Ruegeria sp. Ofav3-42]|uniref:cation diffusion facilitator family transporter n=1 Tax=Ruegeria sp. Ofav3-42 TaxID=2917759 RepID=UPI001EF45E5E|nr:cation diffusion facilitator family transporter [Ruegeria sp. Ofav3-42]MCG7521046.1 cation diffusion facilitator family transporter [Ruegeria sp. Ofav3-42]
MRQDTGQTTQTFAAWAIPVSLAVLLLKLLAWWVTGSVALLSDALESVVNVAAALLAYFAVRISGMPPDKKHPFGHKKAEYLSAVAEGTLIVLAALLIIREAVFALPNPELAGAPLLGIAINVGATCLNGIWAFLLLRIGGRENSPALVASAKHIFTDLMTSVGVVVGLLVAMATGWLILDPLIAILVAVNILWEGWKVIRSSVDGLMDASLSDGDLKSVRETVEANLGPALEYHDLRGRRSANMIFVEFHLVVDGNMSVTDAHDICDDIEGALVQKFPGSVFVIHLEPDTELKETARVIAVE